MNRRNHFLQSVYLKNIRPKSLKTQVPTHLIYNLHFKLQAFENKNLKKQSLILPYKMITKRDKQTQLLYLILTYVTFLSD